MDSGSNLYSTGGSGIMNNQNNNINNMMLP